MQIKAPVIKSPTVNASAMKNQLGSKSISSPTKLRIGKPLPYIGGKPSPRFGADGKRMAPSGFTPSTGAGNSVPSNPPLPMPKLGGN